MLQMSVRVPCRHGMVHTHRRAKSCIYPSLNSQMFQELMRAPRRHGMGHINEHAMLDLFSDQTFSKPGSRMQGEWANASSAAEAAQHYYMQAKLAAESAQRYASSGPGTSGPGPHQPSHAPRERPAPSQPGCATLGQWRPS